MSKVVDVTMQAKQCTVCLNIPLKFSYFAKHKYESALISHMTASHFMRFVS